MNQDAPIIIETAPSPTHAIICLHGLGASGHDFMPVIQELKLPETLAIRFIFPHAPVQPVSAFFGMPMPSWYDILGLSHDSQQDEAGIRKAEQLIQQLIMQQIEQGIAPGNIFLGGISQGGALALHTGLRYPEKLAGIIGLSTYLPLADLVAKEAHDSNTATPIFLAHGEADPVIPLEFAEISRQHLQDYPISWYQYPELMHNVCEQEIQDLMQWLMNTIFPAEVQPIPIRISNAD